MEIVQGQKFKLSVGARKSLSFIQYLKPLTAQNPYFSVQIKSISIIDSAFHFQDIFNQSFIIWAEENGCVTIGLAGLEIKETVSPGSWNNTIGFESITGKCLSSHRVNANTNGVPVVENDTFGIYVSHFGTQQSTVVFVHNDQPVATRYHFESDLSKYLPTITFECGPVEVEVLWQHSISTVPKLFDVISYRIF